MWNPEHRHMYMVRTPYGEFYAKYIKENDHYVYYSRIINGDVKPAIRYAKSSCRTDNYYGPVYTLFIPFIPIMEEGGQLTIA